MPLVDLSLLIISSLLGFYLTIYIARKRHAPGSGTLSVLILGASIWSISYAFELMAASLPYKLFWEKFEYFGVVVIPLAWFKFIAHYLGNPKWMKQILRHTVLLMVIPVTTLVLVWTNEFHNLMWQLDPIEPIGKYVMLDIEHGPWFWVLMAFSFSLMLLGSVKLALSLFQITRLHRWQIILASVAIVLPWISNILYVTGINSEYFLDRSAFIFLFSGVLFAISLFRFHLINIIPIAQGAVFAGISDCVLVLDMNNTIIEMNPAAKNISVCPGDRAFGKEISQVLPDIMPFIEQAGYATEYKGEYGLGIGEEQQFYDLHISLLSDPYTIPIGRVVVLHQITQHKRDQAEIEKARDQLEVLVSARTEALMRAFQQLQEELGQRTLAENRFKDIIEYAPDAMFLLDQSGKILLLNAMAEKMFGYPRDELMGKSLMESVIPQEYRQSQSEYFSHFLKGTKTNLSSFGVDLYAARKDGTIFPMEVDFSRLNAADGLWIAINIHDIGERRQAESALRESEQTYRALFDNANDGILLYTLEGHIIQANRKAIQMLGFNPEEMQSLSIFDVTPPEEKVDVLEKMSKLLNGGVVQPYQRMYLKKSGDLMPTENYKVLVFDANGKPKFFQNVARDITERIKAQQAQNQLLEEIEQSNEQLRSLALRLLEVQELERKDIAAELHDRVGQNLTGLNLNLKILQNQLSTELTPEAKKRLDDSLTIVEETTHKIRDVMADLNPPVLDEYGLLPAIKWYSNNFSERTGIITHIHGDKLEPRLSPGTERILFRLVQESLNNVAKHAQATEVDIEVVSDKNTASLCVKDNGIGFDSNGVNHTASQPHWGFLSMQKRAASIGAELTIESSPGRGTQVLIKVRRDKHGHKSGFSR